MTVFHKDLILLNTSSHNIIAQNERNTPSLPINSNSANLCPSKYDYIVLLHAIKLPTIHYIRKYLMR